MTTDNSRVGHTPGPWRTAGGDAILAGRDDSLTVVGSINKPEDAALAAAAPELLEALNYYADQLCEGWCEGSPDCAHFDDCGGCLARRVAFKATGAA